MLDLLDSDVWTGGQKVFSGGIKNIKIRNPFDKVNDDTKKEVESDIIRVAVDLRYASNFQQFWN